MASVQASYLFGAPHKQAGPLFDSAALTDAKPFNWTGFYAGGHFGAGWGKTDWTDPAPGFVYGDKNLLGGAIGGGQVGANWQAGPVVVGAEVAESGRP